MIEGGDTGGSDMRLCARRSVWRRDAGQTVPNAGRLASAVALTEDGERISIIETRGSFRFELEGQQFRFGHLGDAEVFVAGWLLRAEGFCDDTSPGCLAVDGGRR